MGGTPSKQARSVPERVYTDREIKENISRLLLPATPMPEHASTSLDSLPMNQIEDREVESVYRSLNRPRPATQGGGFVPRRDRYSKYHPSRAELTELTAESSDLQQFQNLLKNEERSYRQVMHGGADSSDYQELGNPAALDDLRRRISSLEAGQTGGERPSSEYHELGNPTALNDLRRRISALENGQTGGERPSSEYHELGNPTALDDLRRRISTLEAGQVGGNQSSSEYHPLVSPAELGNLQERISALEGQSGGRLTDVVDNSDTTPNRVFMTGGGESSTSALDFEPLKQMSTTSDSRLHLSESGYEATSNASEFSEQYSGSVSEYGVSPIDSVSEVNVLPFYNSDSSSDLSFRRPETKNRF